MFGIEGKRLLKPSDDYEALKDFNQSYEGNTTKLEEMHLEYQKLMQQDPELETRLNALPGRVFSGKAHPRGEPRGVFLLRSSGASRRNSRRAEIARGLD